MNKYQRYTITIGIFFILITIIYWFTQGVKVFTRTEVLVDKTTDLDRMLGVEKKEFVDQFVFGLLPSGTGEFTKMLSVTSILFFIVMIAGFLIFLLRNKKKETK